MNETLNHSQPTADVDLRGPNSLASHGSTRVPATAINFHQLDALIPTVSARILKASSETLDEVIQNSLQEILQMLVLCSVEHFQSCHCNRIRFRHKLQILNPRNQ